MKKRISTRLIKSLRPASRPYEIRDTLLKGFILSVQPDGGMTNLCEYARGKRQSIGPTSIIIADQARPIARRIIAEYQLKGTVIPKRLPPAPTLAFFINHEYASWQIANNKRGYEEIERIRRLESGMNPTTVNRQLASLQAVLSKAVTWAMIHEHPLVNLK